MANQPLGGFIWGSGGAQLTPDQIALRRALNQRKLSQGSDTSPVGHWSAGLARVTDAIGDVLESKRLNAAQLGNDTYNGDLLGRIMGDGIAPQQAAAMPSPGASPTVASNGDLVQGVMEAAPASGNSSAHQTAGVSQSTANSNPYELASSLLGKGEVPDRAVISEYLKTGGVNLDPATTAWCAAYVNSTLAQTGFKNTGSNAARSFTNYGEPVDQPTKGDIAVFSRGGNPSLGHVGFFDSMNPDGTIKILAGNQGDAVSYGNMPAERLLGYRRPVRADGGGQAAIAHQAPAAQQVPPQAAAMVEPAQQAPALPPATNVGPAPAVAQVAQAMAPQQAPAAPQSQGINPALIRAITDPRANPQTKQIAQILIQQQQQKAAAQAEQQQWLARQQYETQQKQSDPAYQLSLQKTQAELDEMRNPRVKPTSDIQEYEYAKKQGFNGSFAQFQSDMKRAGANNTTINTGEGNKFYNTLDEANAKTFSGLSEQGMAGRSKMAQIDRLEGLMANAPQGAVGVLKQAAGEYGIPTEGLSDIQAATALIGQLVPQQRAPGSGTVSDADLALFKQSLPRLINQPGGNQAIIQTMRGLTDYQIKMGEIADRVANREQKQDGSIYTPADARKDIAALPNPLAAFKPPEGQPTPNEGWKEISPGVRVRKVN